MSVVHLARDGVGTFDGIFNTTRRLKTAANGLEVASAPFADFGQNTLRLHNALARGLGRPDGLHDDLWLFAALCILTGTNLTVKKLVAALPAAEAHGNGFDVPSAMANIGFTVAVRHHHQAPKHLPALVQLETGSLGILAEDPETGRVMWLAPGADPTEPPARTFSSTRLTWVFGRSIEQHPMSEKRRSHTGHSWFRALLAKFESLSPVLVLISLALGGAGVLVPVLTVQMYVQVIGLGSVMPLPAFAIAMALVLGFEMALVLMRARLLAWMANRLDYLASVSTFDRILRMKPEVAERAAVTDQASRIRSFESVRDFLTGPMFAAALDIPVTLAAIAAIGFMAGWLAVIPVLGVLGHVAVFFVLQRRMRLMTSIAADEATELQRAAIETFDKREAIREAGLQQRWSERLVHKVRREQKAHLQLRLLGATGESVSMFVFATTMISLLAGGAMLSWETALAPGALLAVIILAFRALTPFHVMCLSIQRFEQLRNSVQQLNAFAAVEIETPQSGVNAPVEGAISLVNLGFRAGDTRPVFYGLDLEIDPGEIIGITGANGAGKSTLLRMVKGMTEPSIGTVRLDGIDMRQMALEEVRGRIGYVPQQPQLFLGSLKQNLLFVDPLAGNIRIERALQIVGLGEDMSVMGLDLDTPLDAARLQALPSDFVFRFAVAQALLSDSRLLLIDEMPNGVLGRRTGVVFEKLLEVARGHRTVLFVSHRSDHLRLASKIIGLRYGRTPIVSSPEAFLEQAA